MTQRITDKHLEGMVARLNHLTGMPEAPYVKNAEGRLVAQIGNYHISRAYGGVCLHQICNESGGVHSPIMVGHVPKRELYNQLYAFIRGIETQQEANRTD